MRAFRAVKGLTLVELLITLALIGFVSLSIANFIVKGNAAASSIRQRFNEVQETQMLIGDIQSDLKAGARISNKSFSQRLEYTVPNGTAPINKIYRISSDGAGRYILELSKDNEVSWESPYRISNTTRYMLQGTPLFLYASATNNCTNFSDTNANGYLDAGDSAGILDASCPFSSGGVLSSPSQAQKIDLNGFQFTTGQGYPEATRNLPTHYLMAVQPPLLSYNMASSTYNPLIKMSVVSGANSGFGSAFSIRGIVWDPARNRLILVGNNTGNKIFTMDRMGIVAGSPMNNSTNVPLVSAALKEDGSSLVALGSDDKIYTYTLANTSTLTASATLDLKSPSNLINTPKAIAYDPATPSDFYIVGNDPGTGALKIYERNLSTGALVGTPWALPAVFDASNPPSGLIIEPTTGDFLLVKNNVYSCGSGGNNCINIYRLTRAGASSSMGLNITSLGSSASSVSGYWGLAYNPLENRIFLSDANSNKVYEILPDTIISTR